MSRRRAYQRLHGLVESSVKQYAEQAAVVISKELEKNLLLSLHMVFREIQLLKLELDGGTESESDNEMSEESVGTDSPHSEEHCVSQIANDLVCLFGTASQFVQHFVGKILVAFSEFVAESGSNYESFLSCLVKCLELAVSSVLPCPSAHSSIDCQHQKSDDDVLSCVTMKPELRTANWCTASSIIQILRNILKKLKQDDDDHLMEAYLKSISSCLCYIPWGSLGGLLVVQSDGSDHLENHISSLLGQKPSIVLLGNLVQLFSSLADRGGWAEAAECLELKHHITSKIRNLIPLLSGWCLGKQGNGSNKPISHYFKHKLLILMVRLTTEISPDRSIILSWLELLHKYFEDVLNLDIRELDIADSGCLHDSPFLLSTLEGEGNAASVQHLQRLVILLFLKCVCGLITLDGEKDYRCDCAISLTLDLSLDFECCGLRKALTELYIWLRGQLPSDPLTGQETYFEKCMKFSSSFLQLFVHEDDMLFQVLLQLLDMPFSEKQRFQEDGCSFQELKYDILNHVSNIFHPMLLFHMFLANLHYDHQILLDYLISKDLGISCVEYLLRCLRRVSESWDSFKECSGGKVLMQPSNKKRKIVLDEASSLPDFSFDLRRSNTDFPPEKISQKSQSQTICESEESFEQAKRCLILLRMSVESLHQKGLFPYNAGVLLKRLRRFEQLCHIEEKQIISDSGSG